MGEGLSGEHPGGGGAQRSQEALACDGGDFELIEELAGGGVCHELEGEPDLTDDRAADLGSGHVVLAQGFAPLEVGVDAGVLGNVVEVGEGEGHGLCDGTAAHLTQGFLALGGFEAGFDALPDLARVAAGKVFHKGGESVGGALAEGANALGDTAKELSADGDVGDKILERVLENARGEVSHEDGIDDAIGPVERHPQRSTGALFDAFADRWRDEVTEGIAGLFGAVPLKLPGGRGMPCCGAKPACSGGACDDRLGDVLELDELAHGGVEQGVHDELGEGVEVGTVRGAEQLEDTGMEGHTGWPGDGQRGGDIVVREGGGCKRAGVANAGRVVYDWGMSEHEAEHFREHGWCVLRGVVCADALRDVEAAFDAVMSPWMATRAAGLWQLPGGARAGDELLAHLRRGGLAERVAGLLGAASLRLLQDTLIVKSAGSQQPIAWHQDYNYTGFLTPERLVSVRLAVTREDEANGCMKVVDGSHAIGLVGELSVFSDALTEVHLEDLPEPWASEHEARTVSLELEPGDVSVHHCLTVHGSFENGSDEARKTIVTHLFDGACRLARERLPEAAQGHFVTDDAGRLVGEGFETFYTVRQDG